MSVDCPIATSAWRKKARVHGKAWRHSGHRERLRLARKIASHTPIYHPDGKRSATPRLPARSPRPRQTLLPPNPACRRCFRNAQRPPTTRSVSPKVWRLVQPASKCHRGDLDGDRANSSWLINLTLLGLGVFSARVLGGELLDGADSRSYRRTPFSGNARAEMLSASFTGCIDTSRTRSAFHPATSTEHSRSPGRRGSGPARRSFCPQGSSAAASRPCPPGDR
jgi:hypothetical protein